MPDWEWNEAAIGTVCVENRKKGGVVCGGHDLASLQDIDTSHSTLHWVVIGAVIATRREDHRKWRVDGEWLLNCAEQTAMACVHVYVCVCQTMHIGHNECTYNIPAVQFSLTPVDSRTVL